MKVDDLRPRGASWSIRLHEKVGKHHVMPCHHALAEALHTYILAAGMPKITKVFSSVRRADTTAMRCLAKPWASPMPGA